MPLPSATNRPARQFRCRRCPLRPLLPRVSRLPSTRRECAGRFGAEAGPGAARIAWAPPESSGGSEVYRIEPDGNPRRVWSNAQDLVYAIAFDAQGRALLGAGNKGSVYRIESPTRYTALLSLPVTQITAFRSGPGGRLYAAAGNTGKVYEIGPEVEREGAVESDVFDSAMYTLWGRLSFEAHLNGGQIAIATRSGNLDQPQKNWSPWSARHHFPERRPRSPRPPPASCNGRPP